VSGLRDCVREPAGLRLQLLTLPPRLIHSSSLPLDHRKPPLQFLMESLQRVVDNLRVQKALFERSQELQFEPVLPDCAGIAAHSAVTGGIRLVSVGSTFTMTDDRKRDGRMLRPDGEAQRAGHGAAILLPCAFALNPLLDGCHFSRKFRDGFARDQTFAMVQTSGGYLWLGTGSGLRSLLGTPTQ